MGTVRPVVQVGDPVLASRCATVVDFGPELAELVDDMVASMHAADGVGLAANQIGVALRVFVYDCPDEDHVWQRGVVVNPELLPLDPADRELIEEPEGCLSVLGQHADLARPARARVRGQDVTGAPVEVEGTGLLARCLQHETDHLEGRLYIDRLPAARRRAVLKAWAADQQAREVAAAEEL